MKMRFVLLVFLSAITRLSIAQTIPNGDFKKWDESGCPESWGCNNDADCKGKVTKADKINGGAKLTVMHCFDSSKENRSNNVNMNYDDLSAKILKNKKVKISFDYSYVSVGNDAAYVKIDIDLDEVQDAAGNTIVGSFEYNGNKEGILKPGAVQHVECYVNFDPKGKKYNCPDDVMASSIRTTFGIMPANGASDTHKGSTLIINHVKFTIE
jgi:hypothetical protein